MRHDSNGHQGSAPADPFERDVFPTTQRLAQRLRLDDDTTSRALALAWHFWRTRRADFPPSVYARLAVRHARARRDFPGLRTKFRDIWTRLTRWSGAAMSGLADFRPGPERIAMAREQLALLRAAARGKLAQLVDAAGDTPRTKQLAERLRCTPGRVSQLRREALQLTKRL
jgi:hypothetical protein